MTKAWKIVKQLRATFPEQEDSDIILWLQLCDDRDWAAMAAAGLIKPTSLLGKPVEKGGTSCVVSRDVKAVVYGLLRGTGNSRPVGKGEDALVRKIRN